MGTERKGGEPVKTILLVGATGNLGGQIARALLSKGVALNASSPSGTRAWIAHSRCDRVVVLFVNDSISPIDRPPSGRSGRRE